MGKCRFNLFFTYIFFFHDIIKCNKIYVKRFDKDNTIGCISRFEPATDITNHTKTSETFLSFLIEILKQMVQNLCLIDDCDAFLYYHKYVL